MKCSKCKGTIELIAYDTWKCESCGKEHNSEYVFGKPSIMKEIRGRWKKLMHTQM